MASDSSEDEDYSYGNPNCSEDEDEEEDYFPDIVDLQLKKHYTVLNEEQIKKRQNDEITEISTVLSVSRNAATTLLCSFKWSLSDVFDTLFVNEDHVLKSVGLLPHEETEEDQEAEEEEGGGGRVTCNICFSRCRIEECASAICGHSFCKECYSNYIRVSIDDGIGCLLLRCPKPSCRVVVDEDLINSLKELPDERKAKYKKFLLQSYVEQSRTRKWCPGPGCKNAVEFTDHMDRNNNRDVVCDCSHEFCWNCREEPHSPVDCATAVEWEKKNINESENVKWILEYTKSCPNCQIPIEKNLGCDHMSCKRCCHQFCWLCLDYWKNHSYVACNAFQLSVKRSAKRDMMIKKKGVRSMIQRYVHYFERWNSNQRSRDIARADLEKFRNVDKEKLSDTYKERIRSMGGIEGAWLQIVECRRVLRWSYVYGYYLGEDESSDEQKAKKNLFEYLQGQAESSLGRLHEFAEEDLKPFIDENNNNNNATAGLDEFDKYYCELVNLTCVTRNFFRNLVKGLQNGLQLDDDDTC